MSTNSLREQMATEFKNDPDRFFYSKFLISLLNFKAELEKYIPVGSTFQECFDKACASKKDDRAKVNKAKKT